jgi:hypothetical protein
MKFRLIICLFLLLSFRVYSQTCISDVTLSQSASAICSGYSVTLSATPIGGSGPYIYIWSTGETSQTISINKSGTYSVTVSNSNTSCQPVKKSVTITDSPTPTAPVAGNASICAGTYTTLTATAPGGVYQWYDAPVGGTFLASGASFITPIINSPVVYYVQTTLGGCTSTRTAVAVNLNGGPSLKDVTLCPGGVATLSATGAQSYTWYDAPTGGKVLSTTSSYTTPVLYTTATYYVVGVTNGCASAPTPVSAIISNAPLTPASTNITVCSGSPASLHAAGSSGVFNWYSVPTGGVPLISRPD